MNTDKTFLIVGLVAVGAGFAQAPIGLSPSTCAALVGGAVQTAVFADGFCKVTGIVEPHLEFEGNVPEAWNARAWQRGGGGYDGSLVTGLGRYSNQTPNGELPLQQGYVTLGSDGGHKGKPGFDGSFGMDDEALLDYGKRSVIKTHDAALAVIRKFDGLALDRFYFVGAS